MRQQCFNTDPSFSTKNISSGFEMGKKILNLKKEVNEFPLNKAINRIKASDYFTNSDEGKEKVNEYLKFDEKCKLLPLQSLNLLKSTFDTSREFERKFLTLALIKLEKNDILLTKIAVNISF